MLATRRQEPCPLTYWDSQKALPSRPAPGVPTTSGVSSNWKRCGWRPCRRALASASERAMLGGIALRFVDGAMAVSIEALRLSTSTLVVGSSRPQTGLCDACQVAALEHCLGWAIPLLYIIARKTDV